MTVELEILKNVYGGDGMGRLGDGRVCFVRGVFAGERIRAEITEQKRNFTRAQCVEILAASPDRVKDVGIVVPGMVYAPITYAAELHCKEEQLGNFLQKLGVNFTHIEVIAGRSTGYRNKVTYHVQKRAGQWLIGYRPEFSHEVVDVPEDPLASPEIGRALGGIRAGVTALLSQGATRVRKDIREQETLTIRYTKQDGVTWWFGEAPRDKVLTENVCGLDFKVRADGFFQVNPEVGGKLVSAVAEAYAEDVARAPFVTDLYCGVGVFGICARKRALAAPGRLVGIESVQPAVASAKENAERAGVQARFFCERVGGSLQRIRLGAETTVIVDPPRGGLEKNVPRFLAKSKAPRLFYVSCDPATLTRDLQELVKFYRIRRVRLFDMFPRTARFETLVELEK